MPKGNASLGVIHLWGLLQQFPFHIHCKYAEWKMTPHPAWRVLLSAHGTLLARWFSRIGRSERRGGGRVCSDWCHNSRWLQRGSLVSVTAFIITASTISNYRHRHVNGEISSTFPFHRLLQVIKCCVLCVASTVQRHLLRFRRRTDSRVGARNIALVAHWWVEWPHNQIRLQHGPIFVNRSCIHDNGITFFSIKP